jgi:hypothetical protein
MTVVVLVASAILNAVLAKRTLRSVWIWATLGFFLPVFSTIFMAAKTKSWRIPDQLVANIPSTRLAREERIQAEAKSPIPKSSSTASTTKSVEAITTGSYIQDVAGESFYFENIKKLTKNRHGEIFVTATLVREPTNRFDRNAVRVEINGSPVGYIPKDEAVSFHALLNYADEQGMSVTTKAMVWWRHGEDEYGSVSLDINEPDFAVVVNQQELATSGVIWPAGGRIPVLKENENLESVNELLTLAYGESGCTALVEVRAHTNDKGKTMVEILRRDQRLGELSPAAGKKFMPVLEKLQATGVPLFMLCEVSGNMLAAEITLLAKSPEKLARQELAALGFK